jgi:hypothetical protein
MADAVTDVAEQAFYSRLPGHPQQAPDSLLQVARDRGLDRFRGETETNWKARVRAAWSDYLQGGTPQQMNNVLNQWGNAGWPVTWNNSNLTVVESGSPTDFSFTVTIAFGNVSPPWLPEKYGTGHTYGESGFFYGLGASTDIAMLVFLVRKWKPSRSQAIIKVFYTATDFIPFIV